MAPLPNDREEGTSLDLKYDASGLVTAMVVESGSREPLMLAHMNEEALNLTLQSGEAHFYSRSRSEIWHKGATSGNVLTVDNIRIDCDQDAVWLEVTIKGHGAACHTGRVSCFYRNVSRENGRIVLQPTGDQPKFDPHTIYEK